MELYEQIVIRGLETGELRIALPEQGQHWLEGKCYVALQRIKKIIEDDSLCDGECFMKIEEIIYTLEDIGSDGGFRHDFG